MVVMLFPLITHNSDQRVLQGIEAITGQKLKTMPPTSPSTQALSVGRYRSYRWNYSFCGFQISPESVAKPLLYHNNIQSPQLIAEVQRQDIGTFIFSSSCSVYGQIVDLMSMKTPPSKAECPRPTPSKLENK